MRFFTAVLLLAASTAWAQRAPSPTGFGRLANPGGVVGTTGGAGFGRMIYPGTGAPAAAYLGVAVAPPAFFGVTQMLVWGGYNGSAPVQSGGLYFP